LLTAIDGMHGLDFAKLRERRCQRLFSDPYCPNLAELSDNV